MKLIIENFIKIEAIIYKLYKKISFFKIKIKSIVSFIKFEILALILTAILSFLRERERFPLSDSNVS